jgi:ketosteroid isomerase-like protein
MRGNVAGRVLRVTLVLVGAFAGQVPAAACQPVGASEAVSGSRPVPASITRFFADYFRAVEAGEPDGILALIDSDFVIKWPLGREITDRDKLHAALASLQRRVRQEIRWEILEAREDGDWAWVRSVERPTHYPRAGGDPVTLEGSRLTVLRKVGGRWLLHRDYGSLNELPEGSRQ